jgi:hypothetical protein
MTRPSEENAMRQFVIVVTHLSVRAAFVGNDSRVVVSAIRARGR